jgi:tetratricopeptide (TPR) repeat protein
MKGLLLIVVLLAAVPVFAGNYEDFPPCQALDANGRYYDLNDAASATVLNTVEVNHFPPSVEMLRKGLTATLPLDIAFVLNAFPNHYRALNSMAMWQLRNKMLPLEGELRVWSADCYFLRAIDFTPQDWKLHFIYAIYLHKAKRGTEARTEYASAEELGGDSADLYYNRGLLELDLGDIDTASKYADKAYQLGHPLPGLRDRLARAREKKAGAHSAASTPPTSKKTAQPGH